MKGGVQEFDGRCSLTSETDSPEFSVEAILTAAGAVEDLAGRLPGKERTRRQKAQNEAPGKRRLLPATGRTAKTAKSPFVSFGSSNPGCFQISRRGPCSSSSRTPGSHVPE